jgi:hypothetical protein
VTPREAAALESARLAARLLDEAIEIPGTSWRIGIDPLVGLVPGIGDAIGAILSLWVLLVGVRLGAPGSVVARMALNVAIDAVVGSVPVAGDLADFAWKANVRNVRLLEAWLARPAETHRASGALVAALLLGIALVVAGLVLALWRLAAWVAGAVIR